MAKNRKKPGKKQEFVNEPPMGGGFGLGLFVFAIAALIFFLIFRKTDNNVPGLSYSDFLNQIQNGKVVSVRIIDGVKILGKYRGETGEISFKSVIPYDDTELMPLLQKNNVQIIGETSSPGFLSRIAGFLPMIFMFVLILMMMRQNAIQSDNGIKFGQSNARRYDPKKKKVTFADVAGHSEPKKELFEVVDFLKHPKKYTDLGAKIPKGVLLVGDPGTGKTLLARAVAGEAGVEFLHISGSDFVEMFVGVGASRVRDLFRQAREKAPAIVFIDELDAIGKSRMNGISGNDEREQTLNQLLVEMDGFDNATGLILLAATNRADVLDPALLRPGRFDRQVMVDRPDVKGREAILRIHAKNVKLSPDVDLSAIARTTSGFAGADLANVINEAALLAVRAGRKQASMQDFDEAVEKAIAGLQKKTRVIKDSVRKVIAYHETGHALTAAFTEKADPVHKISIIPRGQALGYTLSKPDDDTYLITQSEMLAEIDVLLGGRAAEKIIFGEVSTGAGNDLQRATDIARKMLTDYGMSDKFSNVVLSQRGAGYSAEPHLVREYSEATQQYVDDELARIMAERFNHVVDLLDKKRDIMDYIAGLLLEKEIVEEAEFYEIVNAEAKLKDENGEWKTENA